MQTTIRSSVTFAGVGLHSGVPVRMTISPASAEQGIWFRRNDVTDRDAYVAARWDNVVQTPLCTKIRNSAGTEVSTIEHIMAALVGCGVHNALIDLDGPEIPILDGSAANFVDGILARGVQQLDAPARIIKILKTVEVRNGQAIARLEPGPAFEIDFHIDFVDRAIGRQEKSLNMANGAFVRELCDARTFCRQSDVDEMRANGLALGGSFANAVVVADDQILSPGGLRHSDEAVRHKMLDALGDLALAGAPIVGRYIGHRAGHTLTNQLLRKLFATPGAFEMVTCDDFSALRLPGVGVRRADIPAVA